MMKTRVRILALLFLGLSMGGKAYPQTSSTTTTTQAPSVAFDTTGFPLWAKDLRRAEIVAFGSFPFAIFFTTTAMDIYRSSQHDWDSRYAPWPLKPAGAVPMTQDEHKKVLAYAAAASGVIALADYILVQIKRSKARKAEAELPAGSPIIIRRPRTGEAPEAPPEIRAGPESP